MKIKKYFKLIGFFLCLLILLAPISSAFGADEVAGPKINVMTRNLYLGADIFKVVDAALDTQNTDPLKIPKAVAEVYQPKQSMLAAWYQLAVG